MKSATQCLLLLSAALTWIPAVVQGCSCIPRADTAAEQAAYIKNEGWIELAVIARFVNETKYETFEGTFQDTTFIVNEVLYNKELPSGALSGNLIDVQQDGTMVLQTSTDTTCCLCGLEMSVGDVGKDFFLPLSKNGGLSICNDVCNLEERWCNALATEMGLGASNTEAPPGSTTSTSNKRVCATAEECNAARLDLGLESFYTGLGWKTKGCYSKNNKAFFSTGSMEEMAEEDLPGVLERVFCDAGSVQDDGGGGDPEKPCEVGPTVLLPSCNEGEFCLLDPMVCQDKSRIHTGNCVKLPEFCPKNYEPICGCNGETYGNECMARADGINILHKGECGSDGNGSSGGAGAGAGGDPKPCLTEQTCNKARLALGLESYHVGVYPSKGCFSKNGRAFFSKGTTEEMKSENLPGVQSRIYCDRAPSTVVFGKSSSTVKDHLEYPSLSGASGMRFEVVYVVSATLLLLVNSY